MNTYQLACVVRFFANFTNAIDPGPVDPGEVIFYYWRPQAGALNELRLSQGDVIHDAPGQYHVDLTPDVAGVWRTKWEGSGGCQVTSADESFTVIGSVFSL